MKPAASLPCVTQLFRTPVLPVHAQHLAQQHDRFQQVVVMDEPPLARVVAGVERVPCSSSPTHV
ncbi:MAG: hypothetical protein O7F17_04480, partial [Planctomycetota bacterium]|nr:hypothetical protein [Planctomycetota bacterium]